MKVIFIAGPYRAKTEFEIGQNRENAEAEALACWRKGWAVICPHKNTAGFVGSMPEEGFLKGYTELLKRSDAILMITGWTTSAGAAAEEQWARMHGKKIYYGQDEVPDLAAKRKKR